MTTGILVLLFVAYGLWGTGVFTARQQNKLESDFEAALQEYRSTTTTKAPSVTTSIPGGATTTSSPNGAVTIELPIIEQGSPIGQISIPKIGSNWTFVQGTTKNDLHKGPGHYLATPYPGQVGNAAIAGHRTTNGAPFNRIDELSKGDVIKIATYWGDFTYEVYDSCIVSPQDTWVADKPSNCAKKPSKEGAVELTLTSCHPKRSARQRYVVKARLRFERSDAPAKFDPSQLPDQVKEIPGEDTDPSQEVSASEEALRSGLAGDAGSRGPAAVWATIAAAIGLLWWWGYRRYRHPATWLVGVLPFGIALSGAYYFLERALPAGY